ncbi:MAG: hypothetical protein JST83_11920 [Bacteroidetes bacterium]|nr:hypothetical protein [Bacteroidota bacterium]
MSDAVRVYILRADDTEFFVREDAPKEPLLHISDGRYGKLYNRMDFEVAKPLHEKVGEETTERLFQDFDKCQRYLEDHPAPWEDEEVPSYLE